MKWFYNSMLALFSLGFLGLIAGVALIGFTINYYSRDLPDHSQLKEYEPSIITRIYAGDGGLMAEYAEEKRVFVPIQKIPDIVKNAFLSAEDKNFYDHNGVDMFAVARAVVTNLRNSGSGRRLVGASTITQQVAKNFLLTNEVSYERKIKEAILAMRMEKALNKDQLLELYLNEIFLGRRAYGVAAAAQIYFNKSLEELTIEESAYLAALPKAPNNYHPVRKYQAALDRRNWVIERMEQDGHITRAEAEIALTKPLETKQRLEIESVEADFFAEEVRRELKDKYGQESLYQGGLAVRTSLDPELQKIAVKSLRDGLMDYDKRHGYRGPVARLKSMDSWSANLSKIATPEGLLDNWELAVVITVKQTSAEIGFADKTKETLKLDGVRWARKCISDCYGLGPEIIRMDQVIKHGDVIMVEKTEIETGTGEEKKTEEQWVLRQVPVVQGAIIAIDPHTGRVLAMQGGWTQSASSFNRATQADRQPGSAFKPFVYLTALDNGFTPSTLVLDAPFVIEQAPGDFWRPTNYSNKYYGPSTIRMGVEKSRNLMTVRLADKIGMKKIVENAKKFGIADEMKTFLSYSLGAGETTLLRLTAAYGMLVNGGKKVTPTFIDRIQDRRGKTVFSYDKRPCANCGQLIRWDNQNTPTIPDTREQIADEKTTYQIVSILEGVIERGTARRLKELGRPLAGKTGTTNESKDTWFIGFSPNLVVGVFAGFDEPKSLGKRETGSSVAAPIWGKFMKEALADTPPTPFRVPPGLKNVRVNAKTGRLAQAGDESAIWEVFVSGTEPNTSDYVLDTAVIGGDDLIDPYGQDPYGYGQFGYDDYGNANGQPIYNDGSVEVYGLPTEQEGDESFSYFAKRKRQQQQQMNRPQFGQQLPPPTQQQQYGQQPQQPVYQQPQPRPAPAPQDPNFTGTGGLY